MTSHKQLDRTPLSAAQREICIGQLLDPASPLYNMGMLYEINGAVDVEKFKACWNAVVKSSDALRMRIHLSGDVATQSADDNTVDTLLLDYSDKIRSEEEAKRFVQAHLEQPISLHGPLVESVLIKINQKRWYWYCKQHHIITDATSFAAIWASICSLYEAPLNASENSVIATDYLAYIEAQANTTPDKDTPDTNKSNSVKSYWQTKVIPPSPTLYGRKPTFTSTAAARNTEFFTEQHSQQLQALLDHNDIRSLSPHLAKFQVLLTVLFAYLYRVSGQSSLAIATTAPNRSNTTFAKTPGLFVELLPLSLEIEPAETFASLLIKVKAEVMGFLKNTAPGAGSWVSNRDISAVINYVPMTMGTLDNMPVKTNWLHANHMDRQHALRLHAMDWNNAGRVSLAFDTNDSCFSEAQKYTAQEHWLTLFDAFCADREQIIDAVEIVDSDQRNDNQSTSISSNEPRRFDSQSDPISDRFSTAVSNNPDSVAIVDDRHQLTYADLADRVHALAEHLTDNGISTNNKVAIILPRSLSVPVAVFSVLRAKATYVPVESNNPPERIQQLLDNAKADIVITDSTTAEQLNKGENNVIVLDDHGCVQSTSISTKVGIPVLAGDQQRGLLNSAAYILYTSGSTGAPKGVEISRAALANYCDWAIDYYTGGKPLAFPFFTPFGFDLTVTSLFVPLLSGGSVHVYPSRSDTIDNSLFNVLKDNRVDIIKLTPAHLTMLQEQNLCESVVQQLIVGGEDLKCALAQSVYHAFGSNISIHNEYGPTEATVGCIVHRFNPDQDTSGSVPIGQPVAGMQALVLNDALQKQPDGVAGTLYLSGPSLATGYWQQTDQTEAAFITLDQTGTRHYQTGDLVRMNDNGQLVYMGRQDDQLKIRGARIELAEIESTVLQQTPVLSCAVAPVQTGLKDQTEEETFCTQCGLSSLYPEATIKPTGVCSLCVAFAQYEEKAQMYFQSSRELNAIAEKLKSSTASKYDCIMLLSGGKDSTYALAKLVDLNLSVLAYTLDNGYLSIEAKSNIKLVCQALEVDHEFAETPAMREIFAQSLEQFSNVCNGCFKTIYTLSMRRAQELGIPGIFTGLSRGQFFETRLTEELFSNPEINNQTIDETVMSARKAYHRSNDAVSKLLNTEHFYEDQIFEQVQVYDFYRYNDVHLDDMLGYLQNRLPWVRPKDTGRSTNCLINDVGIHIHKMERGFHNYSLPYSWDVRLGHKDREAAIEELDDDINIDAVQAILDEIGYTPRNSSDSEQRLALYYTADTELDPNVIKQALSSSLPAWMIPTWLVQIDSLPMSKNGKVDKSSLPDPKGQRIIDSVAYVEASTDVEKKLVGIWREQLNLNRIGIYDNFFELGGDSLSAIRIAAKINEAGIKFHSAELFEHQTIAQIAQGKTVSAQHYAKETQMATPVEKPTAFGSLNVDQLDKLSKALNKKSGSPDT